ncbi:Uncharacterised protein [Mycobacteroides abscessus subsp. massiliense]|uniref:hypothetical protein n=1 Tax=Mycobacteroides abscessus TaxID=36809 RepID=UPI0009A8412F|nr:hypothetical protein [Mycobacteroides abscessus]SLH42750.1 Uncharacterised protein [Mycobacteroides abscessus subsp. massiliense]
MTNIDLDIAAYRFVAHQIARENEAPTTVTAYVGAVSAAQRRAELSGGTLASELITELSMDRVAHAAAVSIGPVGMLTLQDWILTEAWTGLVEHAAELHAPGFTAEELMYRRAVIELLADEFEEPPAAAMALAAALVAARVRHLRGGGKIVDLVAAAARDELSDAQQSEVGRAIAGNWPQIVERAETMGAFAAIETAAA